MADDIKKVARGLAISVLALFFLIASIFQGSDRLDDKEDLPIDKRKK